MEEISVTFHTIAFLSSSVVTREGVKVPIPSPSDIESWSDSEREHVARLLAKKVASTREAFGIFVLRQLSIAVTLGAAVLLVPWIMWLAHTLPITEKTQAWSLAWIGFDSILAVVLVSTAWLGYKRRQIALVGLIISGSMMLTDAWFDITLSWGTHGLAGAILSAVLVEVPLGLLLITSALLIMRRSAALVAKLRGLPGPSPSMWHQEFLIDTHRHGKRGAAATNS
jgi:hypothetical protein